MGKCSQCSSEQKIINMSPQSLLSFQAMLTQALDLAKSDQKAKIMFRN